MTPCLRCGSTKKIREDHVLCELCQDKEDDLKRGLEEPEPAPWDEAEEEGEEDENEREHD